MNKKISLVWFCFWVCWNLPAQEVGKPDSLDSPEKLLSRLIQFESMAGEEEKIGKFLVQYCQERGLHTRIFTDTAFRFNFSASLYPLESQKPNIVLQSHLDIVPAPNTELWHYPPFAGVIDSVAVWGRGAVDCKGLMVIQLWALCQMIEKARQEELPYNITLLALSGEETGGKDGAKIITEKFLKVLNPVVVLGEGGGGSQEVVPSKPEKIIFGISVAEKSSLWLRVSANSKRAGHGSVPPKLYATKRLLRGLINVMNDRPKPKFSPTTRQMFRTLGELEGGFKGWVIGNANKRIFRGMMRKYFEEGEPFYPIVYNTITITTLSSSRLGFNQIANKASAILDCRLLPETDKEKFLKKLKNKLGGLRGVNSIDIEILDQSPHAPASVPDKFYAVMKASLKEIYTDCEVVPILFPAGSDNNYFRAKNIPTFGIMPTLLSQAEQSGSHNPNEHITLQNLHKGIEVYTLFLQKIGH